MSSFDKSLLRSLLSVQTGNHGLPESHWSTRYWCMACNRPKDICSATPKHERMIPIPKAEDFGKEGYICPSCAEELGVVVSVDNDDDDDDNYGNQW